jgi:rhodanese-related sulfurtransferase
MLVLFRFIIVSIAAVAAMAGTAVAQDIPKDKQTKLAKYLTPQQVVEVLKTERAKVLFLDIRTRGELQFVGVATDIDGHVPFVEMNEFGEWDDKAGRYKLEPNATFSTSIEKLLAAKGLTKTDKIILICRSGDRSARAVNLLADIGFTNVWNQHEGFEGDMSSDGRRSVNGWKNAGLPWSYKLDKAKVFLPGR